MKILFMAGYGPVVADEKMAETAAFYTQALGLSLEQNGTYYHTGALDGVRHFALWPLSQAAESCFGTNAWPKDIPVPTTWMEMDMDDIESATQELQNQGYRVLVANRMEPWGQAVTRLISPDGSLFGLTHTPWMR